VKQTPVKGQGGFHGKMLRGKMDGESPDRTRTIWSASRK